MLSNLNNKMLALHLFRISFGINYFFHGIVRIPDLDTFAEGLQNSFQNTALPVFIITPIAYMIPFIETIIGLLLILNIKTRETLVATMVLMNILVIGSSFAQKWDLVGLQATYIGFLFLLLYFTVDRQNSIQKINSQHL
ncbi:MAG: DoxX family membrane protein [Flavobacterium sp.]|nr:MAG: DoxX family membrane protein [Flavobacterium sp.]